MADSGPLIAPLDRNIGVYGVIDQNEAMKKGDLTGKSDVLGGCRTEM